MSFVEERLSETMGRLSKHCSKGSLTVGELIEAFHDKGHMLTCLVFATPFLLPIPLPGLSTVFGAVILLASTQLILGRDPWVPASWRSRALPGDRSSQIFSKFSSILKSVEHLIKPRLRYFSESSWVVPLNGSFLSVLALLLALPMPPGFNAPPALAICVIAIGSMENDGLLVLLGWALTLLNLGFFSLFFFLGWEGVQILLRSFS